MDGSDVLRDTEELRPRIEPFLADGEQLQVVLRASDRPAKAVKVALMEAWPFFREHDTFLLVATDRRWLVLESAAPRYAGTLTVRSEHPRDIEVTTSWLSRFDGFDQPYAIDPVHALSAVAANDALEAHRAGHPWTLTEAAGRITAADNDPVTEALGGVVMKVGRWVPRRRRG